MIKTHFASTGSVTKFNGKCHLGISCSTPHRETQWLDIGEIVAYNPNEDRRTPDQKAQIYFNKERRLTMRQAQAINKVICESLNKSFPHGLPETDEEWAEWHKEQN